MQTPARTSISISLVLALGSSLGVAACGGDGDDAASTTKGAATTAQKDKTTATPPAAQLSPQEQKVASAVAAFYVAVGKGDNKAACRLIATKTRTEIERQSDSCTDWLKGALDSYPEKARRDLAGTTVTKVALKRNSADVTVRFTTRGNDNVQMVLERGRWKRASL